MFRRALLVAGTLAGALIVPACAQTSPEQSAARDGMVACGFSASRLAFRYDAELKQDMVDVAPGSAAPTDAQLDCAAALVWRTRYMVAFGDPALAEHFFDRMAVVGLRTAKAESEAWLRQRGMLERLPKFDVAADAADIAKTITVFCGIGPGTRLSAHGNTLRIDGATAGPDTGKCVASTLSASGLGERGMKLEVTVSPSTTK